MVLDELNNLSYDVIGACYQVHRELGPGLLESTYETCLYYELLELGFKVGRQVKLPVIYKGKRLDAGYRLDLIVEEKLILEIKSVEYLMPIHKAQIMTYLRLSELKLGLLFNFNVVNMQSGIKRVIM